MVFARRRQVLARAGLVMPILLAAILLLFPPSAAHAADADTAAPPKKKKVVLIAGVKSHGPVGNGIHDYPWSVKLLKVMLEHSNVADQLDVEFHLDGWPQDASTLNDADTIMVISDGRDGDKYQEAPHFRSAVRTELIARQIKRGCGFITFHFSTFGPDSRANESWDWTGGYFDWEENGKRKWYSAITTLEAEVQPGSPKHQVLRGVKPFKIKEEFYYNIRFRPQDKSLAPIWSVADLPGRSRDGRVVAWAKQRAGGGRGFGTTAGHFYVNWKNPDFRKTVLNALVWTAGADVPAEGVEAPFYTHEEITAALAAANNTTSKAVTPKPAAPKTASVRVLILTGAQYPGHLWQKTTPAILDALAAEPRIEADVSENIEDLATERISKYDTLIVNYCNWKAPGLSDAAKAGFLKYLRAGGGVCFIHFSNGAFHFSLPEAGDSDWPEYRKICRRVWNHQGKSGHDRYGLFTVEIADPVHPITAGMKPFETRDELYFRQAGDLPIRVLARAKSKVIGQWAPMAFVYEYESARVFQTVLGHDAQSLRTPEVAGLVRRAALWTAHALGEEHPAAKE